MPDLSAPDALSAVRDDVQNLFYKFESDSREGALAILAGIRADDFVKAWSSLADQGRHSLFNFIVIQDGR